MVGSVIASIKDKILLSTERFAPDPSSAANKQITDALYETFEEDMAEADVKGLHFYVRNGTVTIYGLARHQLDRDLIVALTEQVAGVREVKDNMESVSEEPSDTTKA